jgi:uncharacterized membrane protein
VDRTAPHAAATGVLRRNHERETSRLQRGVDRVTAVVGWPGFTPLLVVSGAVWMAANLLADLVGRAPWDPAPFPGLQGTFGGAALLVSALVLTTQRREAELSSHRQQLILELNILHDQRLAKIIDLIEEARRDNPMIPTRPDEVATALSQPVDPHAVLEAIKSADPAGEETSGSPDPVPASVVPSDPDPPVEPQQ